MVTMTVVQIAELPRFRWVVTLVSQVRRVTEVVRVWRSCRAWEEHYLQASSYACALQYEPVGCFAHFAGQQVMAGLLPLERDVGVRGFE